MKRHLPLILILMVSLTSASAVATPGPSKERRQIELLLSGYEFTPDRNALERASDAPLGVLFEIADDPAVTPHLRSAALHAMIHYANADVWKRYMHALEGSWVVPAPSDTHVVLLTIPKGFPNASKDLLVLYLGHPDEQVRMTAAHALGKLDLPEVAEVILAQADREQDKVVRQYMEEQIGR